MVVTCSVTPVYVELYKTQTCILSPSVIECSRLNAPANGNVQMTAPPGISATSQDYGAVARYTCNSGYYLDGNQIRNCVGDGTSIAGYWDGSQPLCIGNH